MKILSEPEEKRTILSGYVENRTKEVALAIVLLTLFFLARTFTVTIIPGIFILDFTGAVVHSAASILSWPYTLLFALSTLYLGSNIYSSLAFFIGTQVVFFLARFVGKRWVSHMVGVGTAIGMISYGLLLHVSGIMNINAYVGIMTVPSLTATIVTYLGGLLMWKVFRRMGVFE